MREKQIELFIIDRDPIFRLGLRTALSDYEDLEIALQESTTDDILRSLDEGFIPDLILIEWDFQERAEKKLNPLVFCQQLRQQYPQIPLFLLATNWEAEEIAKAKTIGIRGFCQKGVSIENLVYGLRQVAEGAIYWQEKNLSVKEPNLLQRALASLSQPGKEQIAIDLEQINNQLNSNNLSILAKLFIGGRKRELKSARWLINRLTGELKEPNIERISNPKALPEGRDNELLPPPQIAIATINTDSITAKVFQRILNDLSQGITNQTELWLEIDILQPQVRQKLFYLIIENLEKIILEFERERDILLQTEQSIYELWQKSTTNFFFQNYVEQADIDYDTLLSICDREYPIVKETIFKQIYFAPELFSYLSWEQPLIIDRVIYRPNAPEVMTRAVNLLHNLIIQIANAVMQVILNYFAELEIFKYNLYNNQYNNSRKIARFRNEVVWRYRQEKYWYNPKNIFESCYSILVLRNGKIKEYLINVPRDRELYRLQGLPWLTTIILEFRDALSPRLRSVIALIGNALVFTLTQVVGRGIGLIVQGIIQGVNSTIREQTKRK
jgi:DNA-binding NarL/FixJ family response regulator